LLTACRQQVIAGSKNKRGFSLSWGGVEGLPDNSRLKLNVV
jgi:hypothetical protein